MKNKHYKNLFFKKQTLKKKLIKNKFNKKLRSLPFNKTSELRRVFIKYYKKEGF